MPLDKDQMREYQRQRRAKSKEEPRGQVAHEHYWRRRANESHAECIEFEYQGRHIGGCGETREYTGKLLPAFEGETPFAAGYLRDRILDRVNSKK